MNNDSFWDPWRNMTAVPRRPRSDISNLFDYNFDLVSIKLPIGFSIIDIKENNYLKSTFYYLTFFNSPPIHYLLLFTCLTIGYDRNVISF